MDCADVRTAYIYDFHVYTGKGECTEHGLMINLLEDLMESDILTSPVLF